MFGGGSRVMLVGGQVLQVCSKKDGSDSDGDGFKLGVGKLRKNFRFSFYL